MERQALAEAVCAAETVTLDYREYAGFKLGDVARNWPSEILTGRIAAGRIKGDFAKVVKAYTKAMQAADALRCEVEAAGLFLEMPARPMQPPPPRLARLPTARALVVSSERTRGRSLGPRDIGSPWQNNSPMLERRGVETSAVQGERSRRASSLEDRVATASCGVVTELHGVDTPLVGPVGKAASHSWWEAFRARDWAFFLCFARWRSCLLGLVVTFLVPKLVAKLIAVVVERTLEAFVGGGWRVAVAATEAAEDSGGRFIKFLEDTLDVCLTEEDTSPAEQTSFAVDAAARAVTAVSALSEQPLSPDQIGQVIKHVVVETMNTAESPAQHEQRWRIPGCAMVAFGALTSRIRVPTVSFQ